MDYRDVEHLLRVIKELGLNEVIIQDKDFKLEVRGVGQGAPAYTTTATPQQPVAQQPAETPAPQQAPTPQPAQQGATLDPETAEQQGLYVVRAPMVGTFYRRPSPDKPPFVEEGSIVKEGDVLCLIEAMKIFNEIEAEKGGKVLKILAEDGTPVEYGQPLFIIDPSVTA
ncbi:MAG: acetyl-CoA carboxylase biotin carboxyl carrier protein [Chlorobi bacterium]|nr:acetyl-CoA carboxylase biotin carboxyl carrier protein [Chlorobiota bacterium]